DEIKISVPPDKSIHPLLKSIYDETVKITEADAKMAEAEWKRVTHEEGSPQFSAMPSVNLRPAGAGVRFTDGMALNCGDPSSCVTLFHSASAIFASASVILTVSS